MHSLLWLTDFPQLHAIWTGLTNNSAGSSCWQASCGDRRLAWYWPGYCRGLCSRERSFGAHSISRAGRGIEKGAAYMPKTGFCLHCSTQPYNVSYKNTGHQTLGGFACGLLHALESPFPIQQITLSLTSSTHCKTLQHYDFYTSLL